MSTVDERIAESGILELYEKWYGPNMTPDPAINYRELIINKFNQISKYLESVNMLLCSKNVAILTKYEGKST